MIRYDFAMLTIVLFAALGELAFGVRRISLTQDPIRLAKTKARVASKQPFVGFGAHREHQSCYFGGIQIGTPLDGSERQEFIVVYNFNKFIIYK